MTVDGWKPTSLGEILRLERRPVKLDPEEKYGEIGIYSYGRGIFHKQPRTGFEVGNKDLFLIKQNDFIFQITFAWEGAVGLASDAEDGMYGSVRFPTYRVNETICYPPFLLDYFKTADGRRELVKYSPGSAGRNRVLNTKRLPEILIPLPSLTEQRRIVGRVEALTGRVAEAQALRREASEEARAIIKSERNKIFNTIDLTKYGKPLNDIAQFLDGKRIPLNSSQRAEKKPGDIPYYGASGIVDYINEWIFDETLLLISEDGANIELRSKPIAFIITGKSWVNNHSHVLKFKDEVTAYFLVHFIENLDVHSMFRGATRPKINKSTLESLIVPDIPLEEQRRLVAYLEGLQAQVSQLRATQAETQKELDALMPSILDRAFKGEL